MFGLPILAGLVTGFLIGLTGMGGGALMTPFLILWLRMEPIQAVGTDLIFAAITKIVGGFHHQRSTFIDLKQLMWMACGSLPTAFIGAQFILRQRHNQPMIEELLPTILGIILILVGLITLFRAFSFLKMSAGAAEKWPTPLLLIGIGAVGGGVSWHNFSGRGYRYHGPDAAFLHHAAALYGRVRRAAWGTFDERNGRYLRRERPHRVAPHWASPDRLNTWRLAGFKSYPPRQFARCAYCLGLTYSGSGYRVLMVINFDSQVTT